MGGRFLCYRTLMAARDADGQIWAGVRWMCDGIGLNENQSRAERKKIQADKALSKGGSNLTLPTKGGNQEVLCLKLDFVPLWLAKISITPTMDQEMPELAAKLMEYQLKAKDVLAAAFVPTAGGYTKFSKELQAIFMLDNRTVQHEQRIIALEDSMVVDYGQQRTITAQVNTVVVAALGGSDSPAYHDKIVRGRTYSECKKPPPSGGGGGQHLLCSQNSNIFLNFIISCGIIPNRSGCSKFWEDGTMKKIVCLILAFSLLASLCACGSKDPVPAEPSNTPTEATNYASGENESGDDELGIDSIGDIDVESGLFNVTITVPADFLDEGVTQEDLDAQAKDSGYKSITLNDDGSATYIMTKAQHKEMMDGIKQSIDESLSEMIGSEDYPSIVSIEANDDYTEYKIVVNTEEVGLAEGFLVMGFYIFSGMYHVFNGTEPGNINIKYINETTGAVIEEANSNDMG